MINPMLCSIFGERRFLEAFSSDKAIQVKQNAQTGLCHTGMSGCFRNMIKGGCRVTGVWKVERCQVFFHRRAQKMDDRGTIDLDNGKQIRVRAYRKHCIHFPAPFLMQNRNWLSCDIECEKISEFLNVERAGSHCNKLKHAVGQCSVCLLEISQGAAINLVGCL
jgi:hypothetical protein